MIHRPLLNTYNTLGNTINKNSIKVNIQNFESTCIKETVVVTKPKIKGKIRHLTIRKLNKYEHLK